jgi:hypothetical protein
MQSENSLKNSLGRRLCLIHIASLLNSSVYIEYFDIRQHNDLIKIYKYKLFTLKS